MPSRDALDSLRLTLIVVSLLVVTAPLRALAKDEPATEAASEKETAQQQTTDEQDKASDQATQEKKVTKKVRLAKIRLSGSLAEAAGGPSLFGDLGRDLRQTIGRIDKAAQDDEIQGLVLEINEPSIGRGRINEVREAIKRFRKADKKVYAYFEQASTSGYLIASACDEVVMPESGGLMIPGVYAEMTYYKGMLDKLGLKADFLHIGEAKGAAEPFTRESMSDGVRENLTNMMDDIFNQIVEDIATGRGLAADKVKKLIDDGVFEPAEALEAGLVDKLAYEDQLREYLTKQYEADDLVYVMNYGKKKVDQDFSGTMGLIKLMQAFMGPQSPSKRDAERKVAIVYALGGITSGKSTADLFGEVTMGSETIVKAIREAAEEDDVVAIVLRIDSPGGSALASDMIWRATQETGKPIVASMSNVAASGGYYIAMGCDKIIAEPGTVTGSIGVVGGKISLGGLYDKVGVTTDVIQRGANAGLFSTTRVWNESERDAIRESMLNVYEQFTGKVAQGRHMPLDRVKELAGGRVYTGRDAKQLGLIDELGTLRDAIQAAQALAGVDRETELEIETYPERPSFFESLFGDMDEEYEARVPVMALPPGTVGTLEALSPEVKQLLSHVSRLRTLFRDRVTLVMPYELDIRMD